MSGPLFTSPRRKVNEQPIAGRREETILGRLARVCRSATGQHVAIETPAGMFCCICEVAVRPEFLPPLGVTRPATPAQIEDFWTDIGRPSIEQEA